MMKIIDALSLKLENFRESTHRQYFGLVRQFQDFLGKPLEEATKQDCARYLSSLKKLGRSDRTIKRAYWILNATYHFAVDMECIQVNPFGSLKSMISWRQYKDVRPTQYLTPEKINMLFEKDRKPADEAMFAILFGCGLRRSEVLKLTIGDIQITPKGTIFLVVREPKGGKTRHHAIPPRAWPKVRDYITLRNGQGAKNDDPIFVSNYGANRGKKPLDAKTLYRRYKAATGLAPHSARASMITNLLAKGIPVHEVMKAAGHQSITSTMAYDKLSLDVDSAANNDLEYFGDEVANG